MLASAARRRSAYSAIQTGVRRLLIRRNTDGQVTWSGEAPGWRCSRNREARGHILRQVPLSARKNGGSRRGGSDRLPPRDWPTTPAANRCVSGAPVRCPVSWVPLFLPRYSSAPRTRAELIFFPPRFCFFLFNSTNHADLTRLQRKQIKKTRLLKQINSKIGRSRLAAELN